MVRSGYTLPVFAAAAGVAAIRHLLHYPAGESVEIDLIKPAQIVTIPIEQVAKLRENQALAITRSEPGDNLDITRNTPIWALVTKKENSHPQIIINGGEGIGKILAADGKPAIYNYARQLLEANLSAYLTSQTTIEVTIILPEGKKLAQRTSNAAFGVVEGLSLLGTTGISQPLSSQEQLEIYQQELKQKASQFDFLVLCIGENGLDLARKLGLNSQQLIKTANWLGPMLVTAGIVKLPSILLFGHHGKLIKLAGGIFHTHHHLADARLEILTAHAANLGLPTPILRQIFTSPTTEAALQLLRELDSKQKSHWVESIYQVIASSIDRKCQDYISKHAEQRVLVGSLLFAGDRSIITASSYARELLSNFDILD
jgi:cobalt-precorrin-5B (C1)-methyltransferase